jgi:hypothetical protein
MSDRVRFIMIAVGVLIMIAVNGLHGSTIGAVSKALEYDSTAVR